MLVSWASKPSEIDQRLTQVAIVAKKQCSLFYRFEATAQRMPATEECIWSREGCYNWKETYALALKYSQFFLSLNVKSQDIVGFYITNKPEYMFAELGCWAVGAAVRKVEGITRHLQVH